jgi:hypothetical protein
MSEGHGDIHTIKNILVFFLVLVIIGLVVSISTTVYALVKAHLAKQEDEEEDGGPPPSRSAA